jgi:hypothetical protein
VEGVMFNKLWANSHVGIDMFVHEFCWRNRMYVYLGVVVKKFMFVLYSEGSNIVCWYTDFVVIMCLQAGGGGPPVTTCRVNGFLPCA